MGNSIDQKLDLQKNPFFFPLPKKKSCALYCSFQCFKKLMCFWLTILKIKIMHQKLILLREKKQAHDDDPRGKCTRGYKYKFSHMPLILKKRKRNPPTTTTITSICHKKIISICSH